MEDSSKILPLIKKIEHVWNKVLFRRTKYDEKGGYYLSNGKNKHSTDNNIHIYPYENIARYDYLCDGRFWNREHEKLIDLVHGSSSKISNNKKMSEDDHIDEIILKLRILFRDCNSMRHGLSDWKWRIARDGYVHPGLVNFVGGDGNKDDGGVKQFKLLIEPNPEHKENIKLLNSILIKWYEKGKYYYKRDGKYLLSNYTSHPNFNANITIYPYKNTIVYDYKCLNVYYNESYESVKVLSKTLDPEEIVAQFLLLFKECHNIKKGFITNNRKERKQEKKEPVEVEEIIISPKKMHVIDAQHTKKKLDLSPNLSANPAPKSKSHNEMSSNKTTYDVNQLYPSPKSKSFKTKSSQKNKYFNDITSTSPIFIPKGLIINS